MADLRERWLIYSSVTWFQKRKHTDYTVLPKTGKEEKEEADVFTCRVFSQYSPVA